MMAKSRGRNGARRGRRRFLKTMTLGAGSLALPLKSSAGASLQGSMPPSPAEGERITYPRVFQGSRRKMIGFPLGGVAAGNLELGGRGQLKEWWIFNRPDKGRTPQYAFPAIWVKTANRKPRVRVLEAQILPPYERNPSDLGSANVPGLPRLRNSKFTGEYPMARVDFEDPDLPVDIRLEAFTPLIPHEPDDSGLPLAVLRYHVSNPGQASARVSIAYSIENPIGTERAAHGKHSGHGRQNDYRKGQGVEGLLMLNPFLPGNDPQAGTLALSLLGVENGQVTYLRGWPTAPWWQSPLLFWEDFSTDGRLGPEAASRTPVGALCLSRDIPAGAKAEYTFLLAWHFPNRTPRRCGWHAPKGHEDDLIGNYYCTRFKDAWDVAAYAARSLPALETRTRKFMETIRNTTVPDAAKDAAMANLSTLATPTCFRTADGAFHGFEGCVDHSGCCYGSCTHVYAYEPLTAHVFPSFSRSMREQQFGFLTDTEGRMDFREMLPYGIEHMGVAAADGQMACIVKLYLDWRLCGNTEWLRGRWPGAKRALEFAWIKGGWDANRDGVMEGVQHNTYDVEFLGPNPFCSVWYLAALRAASEMARTLGEESEAKQYQRLFERGSHWIDSNLFNGEFYIQKITPIARDQIAKALLGGMGSRDPEHPSFQVGDGCLADQLMGQYFAELSGLGLLLDRDHVHKALGAIYEHNYKRTLADHACVQRVYALNGEAGLVVCDYPQGRRPQTPFPYFAEVWSGIEYAAAALMVLMGKRAEGMEIVESARRRFDGEKRNPWNEAECGYHYARPMSSWAPLVALTGFSYHAGEKSLAIKPAIERDRFSSFWSTGTGWGDFTHDRRRNRTHFALSVTEGELACRTVTLPSPQGTVALSAAHSRRNTPPHEIRRNGDEITFIFKPEVVLKAGDQLRLPL